MTEPHAPWVDGLTIGQVLRESARRFGPREALVFRQVPFRGTFDQFDRLVDDVARGLIALGFEHGDHLGIWSTNWPAWVLLQFASARVGVVLVTFNPSYREYEVRNALEQSDVRGLALIDRFKTSDYYGMLSSICPELATSSPGTLQAARFPHLRWVLALHGPAPPGMLAWSELLEAGRRVSSQALASREARTRPLDPINIQYTSGTTGFPKGAMLSHRNLLMNGYHAGRNMRLQAGDRICIPVPLYHCFGCVLGTIVSAVHGASMIFPHEHFRPDATLDAIEQERCSVIYGVPTMFLCMLEHETYPGRDLSCLRTGIMAGSPCPIELMRRVSLEMGARELTIGYGQTEASPLITQTRFDDPIERRVCSVGRPIPGVEVRILDPATHREVPDGSPGELCARGHCVMLGYYKMPDQTARAIDAEGWLHTGDLATRLPEGFLHITGRIKDTIIRGGENIAPREVEERLHQHPRVQDVQVVGVPSRKFGEEVLACVKLRTGQQATKDDLRAFCAASLAHFKVPRYVLFVDEFPTTVTGKIQKYRIREQAIQTLGLEAEAHIETA